MEGKIANYS
jgi:hypothetical protein